MGAYIRGSARGQAPLPCALSRHGNQGDLCSLLRRLAALVLLIGRASRPPWVPRPTCGRSRAMAKAAMARALRKPFASLRPACGSAVGLSPSPPSRLSARGRFGRKAPFALTIPAPVAPLPRGWGQCCPPRSASSLHGRQGQGAAPCRTAAPLTAMHPANHWGLLWPKNKQRPLPPKGGQCGFAWR